MKTNRQTLREAKQLFRLCMVDGALDDDRVRQVVDRVIHAGGTGNLKVLSRFHRLVRLARAARSVKVESATPLQADLRTSIESGLEQTYGRGLMTSYADNQTLLGGVRITVGSDVYDGSIQGRLSELEEHF
jgi:F-type H+-transporting ATPase subunit delta